MYGGATSQINVGGATFQINVGCSLKAPESKLDTRQNPPAPPYYPFPRGNIHTRGNICMVGQPPRSI